MDAGQSKGKEKVHTMDSLSQDSVRTYKRRRQPVSEPKPADVGEQQNPHAFWKIRDTKGWEHGIMIDGNRQHWKCKYCSMTGYSGGVSRLKRHLVGGAEIKKCPAVPEHVTIEMKHLMYAKKEKREKRAAQRGGNSVNSRGSSDDGKDKLVLLPANSDALTGINSHVLEEITNQTNAEHQKPAHERAAVTISEPMDLIRLNTLAPSTSQGLIQLSRPDSTEVSNVQKDLTCHHCGKEARGNSVLTCNRCMVVCHPARIEAPLQSVVSDGRWYCESCSSTFKESAEGSIVLAHDQPSCSHGSSVTYKKLEVCKPPNYLESVSEETPTESSRAIVVSGMNPTEVLELSNAAISGCCKICGDPEENNKRFLICGHSLCQSKYYHIRCMNGKQIASNAQRDKPCWYCPSCLCQVCLSNKDDDLVILCDGCDEGYHLYCLTPPHTSIPEGEWYCSFCTVERAKEGPEYEQRMLKLHRKDNPMVQLVDIMLSAAEKLSVEEQSVTATK